MYKPTIWTIFALFWASISWASDPSHPRCYELEKHPPPNFGEVNVKPVCSALLKELNEHCDSAPFICELPQFSGNSGLSSPDWKTLPAEENRDKIQRLMLGAHRARVNLPEDESSERWKAGTFRWIDESIEQHRLHFQAATFDITNGGYRTLIYRVTSKPCTYNVPYPSANPSDRKLLVPTPATVPASMLISEAEKFSDDATWLKALSVHQRPVGSTLPSLGDAFFFENHFYVAVTAPVNGGIVAVEVKPYSGDPAGIAIPEACSLTYVGSNNDGQVYTDSAGFVTN